MTDVGVREDRVEATRSSGGPEPAEVTTFSDFPARRPLRVALLGGLDAVSVAVAILLAYVLWALPVREQRLELYLELWPILGLFVASYWGRGLYPGFGLGAVETLRRSWQGTSLVFAVLAASSFLLKIASPYSRVTFAIAWVAALLIQPTVRFLVLKLLRRLPWWSEPVVVYGDGPQVERALDALKTAHSLGYRPLAVLRPEPGEDAGALASRMRPWAEKGVRVAVVTLDEPDWPATVAGLQRRFRQVIALGDARQMPIDGVRARNLGGVLGFEFSNQLLRRRNRLAKRSVDLVLGSLGLLPAVPVLAVSGVAVRCFSRGPIFYLQEREGQGGRAVRVWKLRTMVPDAEQILEEHLAASAAARSEWRRRFKLERDPRLVPVVGSVLRRFSIDELPQLWNVVRGEMSLVGPRPLPAYHLAGYSQEHLDLRRSVRPGMTGMWQVMSRFDGDPEVQEVNDGYYIRNWSIWLDLYLLGRTVLEVLSGSGR